MVSEAFNYTCRPMMEKELCCLTMNNTVWSLLAAVWFPLPEHPSTSIQSLFCYLNSVKGLEVGHKCPYSSCYNCCISPPLILSRDSLLVLCSSTVKEPEHIYRPVFCPFFSFVLFSVFLMLWLLKNANVILLPHKCSFQLPISFIFCLGTAFKK